MSLQLYDTAIKTVKNIKFWIFILFAIRLIGITNPPLEVGHNWRQTTVTMVSRNFLEIDNNILYPRIDIAGEKSGITGMEFPLLNYLIYLMAEVFGYQHWYGRLINLIISSLGLWFFYKLIRKYFPEKVSFYSTLFLALSIWFTFSRKIMPDTFSMSMIIACLYYGTNYLENNANNKNFLNLIVYVILLILGLLSKLPSGYILVIFLLFFFDKRIPTKRKLIFSAITILGVVPIAIWYFYWVPYLVDTYGFWHFFMGNNLIDGFNEIIDNLGLTLKRFYDTALKYIGFAVFVLGLILSIINKEHKIYVVLALSAAAFSIIIFKAGYAFPHHNYYIIPFAPVMALVAGYGLATIKYPKIVCIILIAMTIEVFFDKHHDFIIKEVNKPILNLEKDMDKVSQRNDLILINSNYTPTPVYFSHRKGWVNTNEEISNETYVSELKQKGLKFIVILKKGFGTEISLNRYKVVFENEDYCIYAL